LHSVSTLDALKHCLPFGLIALQRNGALTLLQSLNVTGFDDATMLHSRMMIIRTIV